MRRSSLRRWSSSKPSAPAATEIVHSDDRSIDLAQALQSHAAELEHAAFVVVGVEGIGIARLHAAVAGALAGRLRPRLCLSGTRAALASIDERWLRDAEVGLMLDEVGLDTPLSELVWDRIEAVRFDTAFIASAARVLRHGCALDSMHALAKQLGLCTFGSDALPGGAWVSGSAEFDYMPEPAVCAPSFVQPHAFTVAPAVADTRAAFSRRSAA